MPGPLLQERSLADPPPTVQRTVMLAKRTTGRSSLQQPVSAPVISQQGSKQPIQPAARGTGPVACVAVPVSQESSLSAELAAATQRLVEATQDVVRLAQLCSKLPGVEAAQPQRPASAHARTRSSPPALRTSQANASRNSALVKAGSPGPRHARAPSSSVSITAARKTPGFAPRTAARVAMPQQCTPGGKEPSAAPLGTPQDRASSSRSRRQLQATSAPSGNLTLWQQSTSQQPAIDSSPPGIESSALHATTAFVVQQLQHANMAQQPEQPAEHTPTGLSLLHSPLRESTEQLLEQINDALLCRSSGPLPKPDYPLASARADEPVGPVSNSACWTMGRAPSVHLALPIQSYCLQASMLRALSTYEPQPLAVRLTLPAASRRASTVSWGSAAAAAAAVLSSASLVSATVTGSASAPTPSGRFKGLGPDELQASATSTPHPRFSSSVPVLASSLQSSPGAASVELLPCIHNAAAQPATSLLQRLGSLVLSSSPPDEASASTGPPGAPIDSTPAAAAAASKASSSLSAWRRTMSKHGRETVQAGQAADAQLCRPTSASKLPRDTSPDSVAACSHPHWQHEQLAAGASSAACIPFDEGALVLAGAV